MARSGVEFSTEKWPEVADWDGLSAGGKRAFSTTTGGLEFEENPDHSDIATFAAVLATHRAVLAGPCAFIVAAALFHGRGRMLAGLLEPSGITAEVFQNHDEAMRWLNGGGPTAGSLPAANRQPPRSRPGLS